MKNVCNFVEFYVTKIGIVYFDRFLLCILGLIETYFTKNIKNIWVNKKVIFETQKCTKKHILRETSIGTSQFHTLTWNK